MIYNLAVAGLFALVMAMCGRAGWEAWPHVEELIKAAILLIIAIPAWILINIIGMFGGALERIYNMGRRAA